MRFDFASKESSTAKNTHIWAWCTPYMSISLRQLATVALWAAAPPWLACQEQLLGVSCARVSRRKGTHDRVAGCRIIFMHVEASVHSLSEPSAPSPHPPPPTTTTTTTMTHHHHHLHPPPPLTPMYPLGATPDRLAHTDWHIPKGGGAWLPQDSVRVQAVVLVLVMVAPWSTLPGPPHIVHTASIVNCT
jgi:hypothetical protein